MKNRYLRFYLIALAIILALSAYPLYMGLKVILLQWRYGRIPAVEYIGYTIPYTAICLSVMIVAALHPALSRLRRYQTPAAMLLGFGLFTGIELYMESFTISTKAVDSLVRFQSLLCAYTPSARAAFQQSYTDAFKIHYFLIAFILIGLAVSLVYGYGRLPEGRERRMPLHLQLAAAVLLLGLCVLANFTGFFRLPADVQPPVSGFLTGLFFIVLGTAAGILAGSRMLRRGGLLSVGVPSTAAVLVCLVMYFGEYRMMGGTLYRFGSSFFFEGLPGIALAPADILVVLLAGLATAAVLGAARQGILKKLETGGVAR